MNTADRILGAIALAAALVLAGCTAVLLDDYEPNDTLAEACDLESVEGNGPEQSWTATISPTSDDDFYRFRAEEGFGFGFPGDDELLTLTVRLVPPQAPNARNYDLYLYNGAGSMLGSSTNTDASEETIVVTWDGVVGMVDSRDFYIEVHGLGRESSTSPYTLYASLTDEIP